MIVDIVDKYCTDDNNPIKNLRLKQPEDRVLFVADCPFKELFLFYFIFYFV
jgi:hypothetical protein